MTKQKSIPQATLNEACARIDGIIGVLDECRNTGAPMDVEYVINKLEELYNLLAVRNLWFKKEAE
jgi:hypothetical protein